jgi:pimeloyl-ACP methyl ester carboxylesterase
MPLTRIVLVHGAATTSAVWQGVAAALPGFDVVAPDRPCSGDLETELDFLADLCEGAVVGGISGGATLGLALASRGVAFRTAVLHEPAAGSLVPGLLAPMAAAYGAGGVEAFATTLYGPRWSLADAPEDLDAVGRDLAMFRSYEPSAPAPGAGPVLLTVGGRAPPVRPEVQAALTSALGLQGRMIAGVSHALHLNSPGAFAAVLRQVAG